MTTVGYGDFEAATVLGQVIVSPMMATGMFSFFSPLSHHFHPFLRSYTVINDNIRRSAHWCTGCECTQHLARHEETRITSVRMVGSEEECEG